MKMILKAYALTLLGILAIVALAFPLTSITVGAFGFDETQTISGFEALSDSVFTYILIIGPALLIAMDYIPALKPFKGKIAIVVPVICIVSLIIAFFSAKTGYLVAEGILNSGFNVDVTSLPGIGFILAFLSYVGMIVAGAVQYHGYTLDKKGLDRLKKEGAKLAEMAKEKAMEKVNEASEVSSQSENEEKKD